VKNQPNLKKKRAQQQTEAFKLKKRVRYRSGDRQYVVRSRAKATSSDASANENKRVVATTAHALNGALGWKFRIHVNSLVNQGMPASQTGDAYTA
jgi:hypothetical protein